MKDNQNVSLKLNIRQGEKFNQLELNSPFVTLAYLNGEKIENVIIAFHGFGSNAANLSGLAQEFPIKNVLWLFVQGPTPTHVHIDGYQWCPIFDKPYESLQSNHNKVLQLVEEIRLKANVSLEKIFLFGFSQGSCMAMYSGLRMPGKLAGVIALSGFLAGGMELIGNPHYQACQETPFFIGHGNEDQVVFPIMFFEAIELLNKIGVKKVVNRMYSAGHTLVAEEGRDIFKFIEELR